MSADDLLEHPVDSRIINTQKSNSADTGMAASGGGSSSPPIPSGQGEHASTYVSPEDMGQLKSMLSRLDEMQVQKQVVHYIIYISDDVYAIYESILNSDQ